MRLNRYLAACGIGSRRSVEPIIEAGRVAVGGEVVRGLAVEVGEGDVVTVDGREVKPAGTLTLVMHKPPGLVCSRDDEEGKDTIYSLLPGRFRGLHHVGRLDRDSEGLLILTNDGDLTQQLLHPSRGVEKVYQVTLDRSFDPALLGRLTEGIRTEVGLARAVRAKVISPRRLELVLHQGLKRQIRLMFGALDYRVKRLVRVRIGPIHIQDVPFGRWIVLDHAEVALLRQPPPPPPVEKERGKGEKVGSGRRAKRPPKRRQGDTMKDPPRKERGDPLRQKKGGTPRQMKGKRR